VLGCDLGQQALHGRFVRLSRAPLLEEPHAVGGLEHPDRPPGPQLVLVHRRERTLHALAPRARLRCELGAAPVDHGPSVTAKPAGCNRNRRAGRLHQRGSGPLSGSPGWTRTNNPPFRRASYSVNPRTTALDSKCHLTWENTMNGCDRSTQPSWGRHVQTVYKACTNPLFDRIA